MLGTKHFVFPDHSLHRRFDAVEPRRVILMSVRFRHCYAVTSLEDLSYGHGSPWRCASNSSRHFSTMERVGSAAASPSGQNVRPPSMFLERSPISTMSLSWPMPSWKRVRSFFIHAVPSRQGIHQPQLSWA